MLCNNPKKYAVIEPEGRIAAQKCIDIVVRHVAVSPSAVQQTDKFRIQIFDESSPDEVVGKRDVLATLHPGAYPKGIISILFVFKIKEAREQFIDPWHIFCSSSNTFTDYFW